MVQRIAVALLLAALAQAIQVAFLLVAPVAITPSFLASQLIVLIVVQLGLALALGGLADDRAWEAAVFLLPTGLAAISFAPPPVDRSLFWALPAAVAIPMLLWARWRKGRGSPLVSGVVGAAAAAELMRIRVDEFHGWETPPVVAGWAGLVCVLALTAVWHARRLPAALSRPRAGIAVPTAAALALVSALPLGFAQDAGIRSLERHPGPAGAEGPPVVLIVLDTVRADHLRAYGYERNTMPGLERFVGQNGVVVQRAVSSSSWTLPSHASLFTGLHPPRHGAHHAFLDDPDPPEVSYPLRTDVRTLAELLAGAGYWTGAVAANFGALAPSFGLQRGFHYYRADPSAHFQAGRRTPWRLSGEAVWPLASLDSLPPFSRCEFFGPGVPYRRASEITDEAIAMIEALGDRPFFLFLNYLDAHTPYWPPPPFRNRFDGYDPSLAWGRSQLDMGALMQGGLTRTRIVTERERRHLIALYDGELAYLDGQIVRLLGALRSHPRWDEMLIVVTSDHGESFGEHGLVYHRSTLYDEQIRIPLFIKPGPRAPARAHPGARLPGPVELVDVFAIVLEHAGIQEPEGIDGVAWSDGSEVRSWLYHVPWNGRLSSRFDRELRSIEIGDWKLIEAEPGEPELYDLRADPDELNDLAGQQAARVEEARARLRDLTSREVRTPAGSISDETLRGLRALGYAE